MNTKQIEELRLIWNQENGAIAFHDLLEKVEQLNQEARQQTAKEIIEMCHDEYNNNKDVKVYEYTLTGEEIEDKIKSKYGIGEK